MFSETEESKALARSQKVHLTEYYIPDSKKFI